MKETIRKVVVVNQASNYLTIGLVNAFNQRCFKVALITGSIHVQGELLHHSIEVSKIKKWAERPIAKKLYSYIVGTLGIWWLLVTRYRNYEVLFVSLPPWGYLLSLFLRHRCSMIIWDVYPDVFKITGMSERHLVYRVWAYLNKKAFRKAYRIFTIGERMADLLSTYVTRERLLVQPIWSIFQKNKKVARATNPFVAAHRLENKFVVQYSGNIGLTHRVEVMIDLAEQMLKEEDILFQIIGRGPRVPQLQKLVSEKRLRNVQFLPFQTDAMFPYSLSAADVGVVILDETTAKGSVPSKSYNLMSYGIPALYIASTDSELSDYAKRFGHAACYSDAELSKAGDFLRSLKEDRHKWSQMALNAEQASRLFRRENADKFAAKYFAE